MAILLPLHSYYKSLSSIQSLNATCKDPFNAHEFLLLPSITQGPILRLAQSGTQFPTNAVFIHVV